MPTLYNADLKPLGKDEATHPYEHAAKLFLADNFRLAPKQSFLYYVCINIDQTAYQAYQTSGFGGAVNSILGDGGVSSQTLIEQYESGLMAKKVELPKYTLDTKTLNSYNRKNIIQTHINYEPINITFHDDAADVVTQFWNDYYTYYYRDSDYNEQLYQVKHKYDPRLREGWGFSPRNSSQQPFLRNIQIFSLHNKRFTEYLIINPYITAWRHGEHDSSLGSGTMENSMTVAYETVKYRTGFVNAVDVNGFGILHYDNFPSPISTSVTNIYTDDGLIGAFAGASKDLARPDGTGSGSGVFGSVLNAYRFYNNLKNVNLKSVAGTVIGQIGGSIINNAVNGAFNSYTFPTVNGANGQNLSGPSSIQAGTSYANPGYYGGASVSGLSVGYIAGAAVNSAANTTGNYINGVFSKQQTNPANYGTTSVIQVVGTDGTIKINPQTNQPIAGGITAGLYNENGELVGTIQTPGTTNGTYNPQNIQENLKTASTYTDSNGQTMNVYAYVDGTTVIRDSAGTTQQIYPGQNYLSNPNNTNGVNVNPANARDIAAAGGRVPVAQYYTDPKTGLTYTVGNTFSAQLTNTLTTVGGAAAGLYVGSSLDQYLLNNTALGKSKIGQTIAAGISTAAGAAAGRLVNNTFQPIVNNITGQIGQVWDSATASIKNVVGSWTNSGGYDANNPTQNIVSQAFKEDGSLLSVYKNGETVLQGTDGQIINKTPGTSGGFFDQFKSSPTGSSTDGRSVLPGAGQVWTDRDGNPIKNGYGEVWGAPSSSGSVSTPPFNDQPIQDPFTDNPVITADSNTYGPDEYQFGGDNFA